MPTKKAVSKINDDLLVDRILKVLDELKALDVKMFDVFNINYCFDYVVVASASSITHSRGIADKIEKMFGDIDINVRIEGRLTYEWVLIDFNSVILHVFLDDIRPAYNLEELYSSWKKASTNR